MRTAFAIAFGVAGLVVLAILIFAKPVRGAGFDQTPVTTPPAAGGGATVPEIVGRRRHLTQPR